MSSSSSNDDEISVTLVHASNGATETISVSRTSTTLGELADFATALFGIEEDGVSGGGGGGGTLQLVKDGTMVYRRELGSSSGGGGGGGGGGGALGEAGIVHGDMVLVMVGGGRRSSRHPAAAGATATRATPAPARGAVPGSGGGGGGGGGGLDFSSLLNSAGAAAPAPASPAPATASSTGTGGLTFNLASIAAAGGGGAPPNSTHPKPIEWDGMSLDDAIMRNPHPRALVEVLLDQKKHPNLMKELNYHSPQLASKMRDAAGGDMENAAKVWREEMMKGSIGRAVAATEARTKEHDMERRLRENPMDEEANKYFGEKIRRKNVDDQYHQMMEEYPESMGRVLMLYIDAEVNGHHIQAFVDSGAQSTIMSSACAERCGLLHLLDTRFEGTAVGVGTGKILGRIHIAPLKIKGHFFPVTITVMDSEKGLGDKNMDFLFGLDMLKRHRCKIDLETSSLLFTMEENGSVTYMEAPFLHEKDLDQSKGGTRGFDADAANADLQRAIEESTSPKDTKGEESEEKGSDSGDKGDEMDVDEASTNKK